MYDTPSTIEYGYVRDLMFAAEFGRFEATVTLHLTSAKGEQTATYFTNIEAHGDQPIQEVRLALVLKAARLHRLTESGLVPMERAAPLAA